MGASKETRVSFDLQLFDATQTSSDVTYKSVLSLK